MTHLDLSLRQEVACRLRRQTTRRHPANPQAHPRSHGGLRRVHRHPAQRLSAGADRRLPGRQGRPRHPGPGCVAAEHLGRRPGHEPLVGEVPHVAGARLEVVSQSAGRVGTAGEGFVRFGGRGCSAGVVNWYALLLIAFAFRHLWPRCKLTFWVVDRYVTYLQRESKEDRAKGATARHESQGWLGALVQVSGSTRPR